jgi:E3 ubiquitin-protein ligase HUWE1
MATFVNNEPTSLAILQEQQVPQALFSQLERHIPASFDVSLGNLLANDRSYVR